MNYTQKNIKKEKDMTISKETKKGKSINLSKENNLADTTILCLEQSISKNIITIWLIKLLLIFFYFSVADRSLYSYCFA